MKKTLIKPTSLVFAALFACGLFGFAGLSPAIGENVPSYATVPSYSTAEQTIRGRIASIVDGQYRITVRDDNGYLDSVALHHGTIINPTGLTLGPGMTVTILGSNGGSVFEANEIDTPYNYAGPRPVSVYYGLGVWYPGFRYGYYGYGWGYPGFPYGYGPSYGLIIRGGYRAYYPYAYGSRYGGYAVRGSYQYRSGVRSLHSSVGHAHGGHH